MLNNDDNNTKDLKLRGIKYLIKRLDHTLSHTQNSTRNIYLINGAILAAIYFTFGKINQPFSFGISSFLLSLLSLINFAHMVFLRRQHRWYTQLRVEISSAFDAIGVKGIDSGNSTKEGFLKSLLESTHGIYQSIHLLIAIFLLAAACMSIIYIDKPPKEFIVTPTCTPCSKEKSKSSLPNQITSGSIQKFQKEQGVKPKNLKSSLGPIPQPAPFPHPKRHSENFNTKK